MLRSINKAALVVASSWTMLLMSNPALATGTRIIQSQGQYAQEAGDIWTIAVKVILFLFGIAAIGFAAWHMLQDYVFAKSDHEKKFSIGKLLIGAVVGTIMCYPGGAVILGGDLTGTGQEVTIDEGEFTKP